jgi:hypothetical protein
LRKPNRKVLVKLFQKLVQVKGAQPLSPVATGKTFSGVFLLITQTRVAICGGACGACFHFCAYGVKKKGG